MRITEVRYERLQSFGDYSNEALSATAAVASGEDPITVLEQLKDWVGHQLGQSQARRRENEQNREAYWAQRQALTEVTRQVRAAKDWHAKAAVILAAHGITLAPLPEEPEQIDLSDTPF